jgi:hypothetical protein
MINKKVLGVVTLALDDYNKKVIDINPDYAPTQPDVIDLVDHYWMDKFRDGGETLTGWKKAFYNIVSNPTQVSSKMVDLDTKDVKIIAENGASFYPAWFYQKDLRLWMKEKQFGKVLNEIVYNLPKYGTVILKKVGDDIFNVPIKNFAMSPDVNKLEESNYIIETHEYTPAAFKKMKWDKAAIKEAIKLAGDLEPDTKIKVYELYGEVAGEDDNYFCITDTGIVLYQDTMDVGDVYKKHDWEIINGRALGRGVVEKLFEAQIQQNRIVNYKTEGLHWSSKHVFQTRDQGVERNLMTDTENGDIVNVMSEITPIAMEERNLAGYTSNEQRWDLLAKSITFAYSEISGERAPAGTPLGSSMLQVQQASNFFDLKKEDLGMFIKDVIITWVIPSFEKNANLEHSIMISQFDDSEIQKIRGLVVDAQTNESVIEHIIRTGNIPKTEDIKIFRSIAEKEVEKKKEIKIPKGMYKNLQKKVDVIITNEQIDVAARLTTLQAALGMLSTNPAIIENPKTKKLFYSLLDLSGISPVELGLDETTETSPVPSGELERGGSIAIPNQPMGPQMMTNTKTI